MKTPYYLFDRDFFEDNISRFDAALANQFAEYEISYSMKTNSVPYIVKTAYECGCMIEVTSFDEYALARSLRIPIGRIVYNGPYKDKHSFIEAVNGNAIVNIECEREIDWLRECKDDARVGIRLNVDLNSISPEDAKTEENGSRFGASFENGDLGEKIDKIITNGATLSGIHVHKTSRTRNPRVYQRVASYIADILDRIQTDIDYIDMGGGYYGGISAPDIPTYDDYAESIQSGLGKWATKKIIIEPGSAAIAAPMSFFMSVIDIKSVGDVVYCTVNGSRIDIDPFFHKTQYDYSIDRINGKTNIVPKQLIAGFTCLENDILFSIDNDYEIAVGDVIEVRRIGAYTMSNTPNFIRMLPAIYLNDDASTMIRKKWTANDFAQGSYY